MTSMCTAVSKVVTIMQMVAVGLCQSDLSFLNGLTQDQPLPFVIGHEGAGIVESIGQGVKNIKPGLYQ